MSIRTRLLLLVFAVWVPAMAGFGLLARATYVQEARTAREHMRDAAFSIRFLIERELDKRVVGLAIFGTALAVTAGLAIAHLDRKSTRLNSSHRP